MSTLLAAGHVLIGAKVGPALAGMAKVNTAFAATAARGAKTGAAMSKAISLPIVAGFGFAIKAAADFESSLHSMQAVSGATDRQMRAVGKTAKQLGADVSLPGTSAKDAAEAMTELAKGGMTAKQAMDAARGTLMLAAAAGIENAQAAEIQSDTLNAFGLSASKAGKVADVLAASANASTAEITDMSLSLKQSATVAKQAGYGLTETAVAISFLANEGIKGSDAGTSLKTMLMRLQAPMGTGAKTIKELGLNLRDSGGELKKLPALAEEFRDKLGGLNKAQRDAAMAAIFGSDAIRAGNILLSKSGAEYAALTAKIDANGAAQKLAESKMRGFNGAMEAFKSTVETAAITIGQILLPMATQAVTKITEWADAFDRMTPAQQRATLQMAAFAAAAGPAVMVLSKLGSAASLLGGAGGLGKIAGPLGIAAVALTALGLKSESARQQLMGMGQAISPVVGFLGKIVASPVAMWMVAAAAAAYGLVAGVVALGGAFTALTAVVAANPLGAFIVVAGLALGAIIGLNAATSGGTSSMAAFRDATNGAKDALNRLKDASLGVESADLNRKAAILEVKAAQQGLVDVQRQVNDGLIKGKPATLAVEQAELRLAQAKLGVRRATVESAAATKTERTEQATANAELTRAVQIARDRVEAAKLGVALTRGSAEATTRLKDAERDLAAALKLAGDNSGRLTSKMEGTGRSLTTVAGKAAEAKNRLNEIKDRAVSVNVNTEDAMIKVLNLIGAMLQITSKTVTVTVIPVHQKGSWTVQETLEHVDEASAKGRKVPVTFTPHGTAAVEAASKNIGASLKTHLTKAVKDSVMAARDAAAGLASTLSGMIGQGIDALTGTKIAANDNSPEAKRLREIEFAQRSTEKARQRAQLETALTSAETDEERAAAQQDINDWILEQERQFLAETLAMREQTIRDEADAKKTAAERGLADLTANLNAGLITQEQFNRDLQALLAATAPDYATTGALLGSAFASSFQGAVAALLAQTGLISSGPGAGVAFAPNAEDPAMVQWQEQRDKLAARLTTLRNQVVQPSSGGGKTITATEKTWLKNAEDALRTHNAAKPIRAKLGGVVMGAGLTDKVPLLTAPGEGVLNHRNMDRLMDMAMGGGGGGRETHLHFHVSGNTILGDDRSVGRRLAEIVAPELNRRIALTG